MKKLKLLICISLLAVCSSFCKGQAWLWAKAEVNDSSKSWIDPFDLATDNSGNIFETGIITGKATFGSVTLNSPYNTSNPFLVKFDNSGNGLWGIALQEGGAPNYLTVAAGSSGNVCFAGTYSDSLKIGSFTFPNASSTASNLFIAMFSPTGALKWASYSTTYVGSFGGLIPYSVTIDKQGNTYLTGAISDSVTLGAFHLYSTGSSTIIAKFDSLGNVLWAVAADANIGLFNSGSTVVTDSLGNAYVLGGFGDSIKIGSSLVTSKSYNDIYLAKFNPAGNLKWITSANLHSMYSTANNSFGYGDGRYLTIDGADNLYITGIMHDTAQFGPYALIDTSYCIFLAKYSPSGNAIWATKGTGLVDLYTVSCNKSGSIFLSGDFGDSISFGPIRIKTDSLGPQSFLFKLDSSGKAECGSEVDNFNDDNNCVAADPKSDGAFFSGDVEVTGLTTGCYFGSYYISGTGLEYGFLAKWNCDSLEGINEVKGENEKVKVYPNPNNGVFTIQSSVVSTQWSVEVFNILGEKIQTSSLPFPMGEGASFSYRMNLSSQPKGVYFYRVLNETGGLVGEGKVVIEK